MSSINRGHKQLHQHSNPLVASTTVAASPPVGLIAAPEAQLTVRVAAYPSREPLAEVTLPPGAALADLRRAIRDAPDMAHRPERLFARWWTSKSGGGEYGTERELPCAEGGGGLGAETPSLRSAGITEDYSLVLVGAGEGEEDPLVAALSAAAVVDQRAEARDARVGRSIAELLAVIAGQAQQQREMLEVTRAQQREMADIRQEAKTLQESLQTEVKELKALRRWPPEERKAGSRAWPPAYCPHALPPISLHYFVCSKWRRISSRS